MWRWTQEGETVWELYRDGHTEFPSLEGNNFCKDSKGFRLSFVTSRTASLSSTIKSSLRCQWSLKYSWDSDLWYIWSLGVGFDELLAYWECWERSCLAWVVSPSSVVPALHPCSPVWWQIWSGGSQLPGKVGPAALPALPVHSHALSCMRSGPCPTPWWSGSAWTALRKATQQGGLEACSWD